MCAQNQTKPFSFWGLVLKVIVYTCIVNSVKPNKTRSHDAIYKVQVE